MQIQEAEEKGSKIESEIAQIVQAVLTFAHADSDTHDAFWDICRYLPMRTEQEVVYVLDCAQNSQDESLQAAFLQAVQFSKPESDEVWAVLEKVGLSSSSAKVRKVVEERLQKRR